MARTQNDLVVKVLDLLGVTQVGQDPTPEDAKKVRDAIGPNFARLSARRIYYVQDANEIDDEVFDPLAVIVANNVGPVFGQSYDPSTDAMQEALLREMQIEPGATAPVVACYF